MTYAGNSSGKASLAMVLLVLIKPVNNKGTKSFHPVTRNPTMMLALDAVCRLDLCIFLYLCEHFVSPHVNATKNINFVLVVEFQDKFIILTLNKTEQMLYIIYIRRSRYLKILCNLQMPGILQKVLYQASYALSSHV